MDSESLSIIIALVVLLALSAFFSASETAYSSMNRIRMKNLAADGDARAGRALTLSEKYDKLLSTVLIGNNIVNIASSALATVLFVKWFGTLGVTLSTVTMTVLVLIFGEITPKTLAKEAAERFAMFAAPLLRGLMVLLTPVNALFSGWKKLVLKMFRLQESQSATEEELLTYVEEVRQEGGINAQEESMIRSVIEFDDLQAIDISTPRVDVLAVSEDEESEKIAAAFHESGFSRLPVYRGSIDNIVGIIIEKDFHYFVERLGQGIADILRPALFITKSVKISALLSLLQQNKTHMAVIVDEYGGTLGIVTVEDILEELVGEIWDEHDEIRQEVTPLENGAWRIAGGAALDELGKLFGVEIESTAHTVGGWVLEILGHIPQAGEYLEADGLHLSIEAMQKNRVATVRVQRAEAPKDAQDET
ncbi:MAG: HlyC/CorC family transporter [Oscillospiraceae bacterium]